MRSFQVLLAGSNPATRLISSFYLMAFFFISLCYNKQNKILSKCAPDLLSLQGFSFCFFCVSIHASALKSSILTALDHALLTPTFCFAHAGKKPSFCLVSMHASAKRLIMRFAHAWFPLFTRQKLCFC